MDNKKQMNKIYTSYLIDIQLKIIDYDEPNNGRALWVADLIIHRKIENQLFKNAWNRLNFYLDRYEMQSYCNKYIFIPAESFSFVINTDTYKPCYLPYKGLSTLNFIGNFFTEHYLVVVYMDMVILYFLKSQSVYLIPCITLKVIWATIDIENQLVIEMEQQQQNIVNIKKLFTQ